MAIESLGFPRTGNQPLSGVGRVVDLTFPQPSQGWVADAALAASMQTRVPGVSLAISTTGQGGPALASDYVNGIGVAVVEGQSFIGGTTGLSSAGPLTIKLQTKRTGLSYQPAFGDYQCYRAILCASFVGAPNAGNDVGMLIIAQQAVTGILRNGSGGVGIVMQSTGLMTFLVNGAALNQFPITLPGFDPSAFHAYEIRLFSATSTTEASIEFWLDGSLFKSFMYGPGSILPETVTAERQFYLELVNFGGPIPKMNVMRWRFMASQSLAGLL